MLITMSQKEYFWSKDFLKGLTLDTLGPGTEKNKLITYLLGLEPKQIFGTK